MSGGDWVAVVVAALAASAVTGALFTLPLLAPTRPRRLVPLLLGLQGGGALVVGAIVAGAAVRSWQLVDKPAGAHVAHTLLTLSRVDGDGSMFALILLAVVALAVLSAVTLVVSARLAAADDPGDRMVACIVLGIEIGLCGYGLASLIGGNHSAAAIVAVVNLPLAMAALVACWPPRALDADLA